MNRDGLIVVLILLGLCLLFVLLVPPPAGWPGEPVR
jgi:hypothetical protein